MLLSNAGTFECCSSLAVLSCCLSARLFFGASGFGRGNCFEIHPLLCSYELEVLASAV